MASVQGADALQHRFTALRGSDAQILRLLGLSTVREAKLLVHRKTGNLGRSIHVKSVTSRSVTVEAGANYASVAEFGSRPHDIKPKNAKALFFPSQKALVARLGSGRAVGRSAKTHRFVENQLTFRKSGALSAASMRRFGNAAYVHAMVVHHPGTKPYPFLIPGAKRAVEKSGLRDAIVDTWNKAA
jgi:hypothetical protein